MGTTFQLNKVYSNTELNKLSSKSYKRHITFYLELYKDTPKNCPWPKAQELYAKHIEFWKDKMIDYIIPVKKTRCYLIFKTIYGQIGKKKIYLDENQVEYINFNSVKVSTKDIKPDTLVSEEEANDNARCQDKRFIEKVQHLEEYGYVYLSNLERIDSMPALEKAFNR